MKMKKNARRCILYMKGPPAYEEALFILCSVRQWFIPINRLSLKLIRDDLFH